jgi:biotin transporter BioY
MGLNTSLLGYVVSAMLIGYMAGALNKRSESFLRMVISGIVAGAIGEILLFWIFQLSPSNVVRGLYGFSVTFLPRIACGILMPIIVKVFMSVMSTF